MRFADIRIRTRFATVTQGGVFMRVSGGSSVTGTNEANMIKLGKDNINGTSLSNSKEVYEKQSRRDYISKKLSELTDFEKRELPVSEKIVLEAIGRANKAISMANRRLEYSIHEKTNEIIVKVINTETDEVIREIPPEKMLDMVACIWEMIGIIVDERR